MTIKLALLQSRSFPSKAESMAEHERLIAEAAQNDANIICTQELCFTPYFCNDQDPAKFDLAEPVPGPVTERFARLAEQYGVVLILSLFEHRAPGICHNTAAIIDADGTFLGKYRKMHIPQDPGFEEKFYFTPGDLGFRAWQTKFGRIGVIICWDQWYPESARLTALDGAEIIFCPTAIATPGSTPRPLTPSQTAVTMPQSTGRAWRTERNSGEPRLSATFTATASPKVRRTGRRSFMRNATSPQWRNTAGCGRSSGIGASTPIRAF